MDLLFDQDEEVSLRPPPPPAPVVVEVLDDDDEEPRLPPLKKQRTAFSLMMAAASQDPTSYEALRRRFSVPLLPRNAHPRDSRIVFDDSPDPTREGGKRHDYFVDQKLFKPGASMSGFSKYGTLAAFFVTSRPGTSSPNSKRRSARRRRRRRPRRSAHVSLRSTSPRCPRRRS